MCYELHVYEVIVCYLDLPHSVVSRSTFERGTKLHPSKKVARSLWYQQNKTKLGYSLLADPTKMRAPSTMARTVDSSYGDSQRIERTYRE